jgi:hypothetical protein
MAERLNALAYAHHVSNPDSANYDPNFNPRSVSFDVRTPQELAAVNEFLLTLGRDVAQGSGSSSQRRSHHSIPQHSGSDEFSVQSYFDAASLSQLGIAGMPGLPGSGASYSDTGLPAGPSGVHYSQSYHSSQPIGRASHTSPQTSQFTSLYPSVNESLTYSPPDDYAPIHSNRFRAQQDYEYVNALDRTSSLSAYQRNISPQGHFHSTPPYDSHSPHSSVSTPSSATPPHMPISMPDLTSFGYLAEPRAPPPVATLAPVNFSSRSMREIVPLRATPGGQSPVDMSSPPDPVEPKLAKIVHRGPPAKLTPSSSSTNPGSLYPLLTSGDTRYKLAPLSRAYRSPSPVSSSRSAADGDSLASRDSSPALSPTPHSTVLPSLRSIASTSGARRSESEELARGLEGIELERQNRNIPSQDRRKHIELIRSLLVTINNDYKRRFGTPDVKDEEDVAMHLVPSRDIEMAA